MKLDRSTTRAAYSVESFCKAHDIGRALFYRALKDGWGPETFTVASKRLISIEAATRWRAKMERRTAEAESNKPAPDSPPDAEQAAA